MFNHDYCRVWFQQDKMTRFARNPYIMTSDNLYTDGRQKLALLKPLLHIQYAESEYGDGMCHVDPAYFGV